MTMTLENVMGLVVKGKIEKDGKIYITFNEKA